MLPGDRIEYIHKYVFGFPSWPMSSLRERKAYFNKELVQRLPVLSQLFLHAVPSDPGLSWKLPTDCHVPDLEVIFHCFGKYTPVFTTRLAAEINGNGTDRCTVLLEGQACDFRPVADTWLSHGDSLFCPGQLIGICFDSSLITCLDGASISVPYMSALPRRGVETSSYSQQWLISNCTQKEYLSRFLQLVESEDVRVLLMAYSPGLSQNLHLAFGLIMIRQSSQILTLDSWQRLGLCFWVFELNVGTGNSIIDTASYLEGATSVSLTWLKIKGHFK